MKTLLEENKKKIKEKIKSPGTVVILASLTEKLREVNIIIDSINKLVEEHNTKIDKASEVGESLKKKFWTLMRFEYNPEIILFIDEKTEIDEKTQKIETDSEALRSESEALEDEIGKLQKKTINIDEAIENISNHLKDMGITHFALVKHGDADSYKIQRDGKHADIYQSLSEGEKTIITFLYFLEQCRGRRNPTDISKKKIIVIDDPISSLSHMFETEDLSGITLITR